MHEIDEADAVAVLLGLSSTAVADFFIEKRRPIKKRTNRKHADKKVTKRVRLGKEKPRKPEKKPEKTLEPLCQDSSVQPRVIQVCSPSKLQVDHSYKDYSLVVVKEDYKAPTKIEEMTFAEKLHHILSEPEYSDFIAWESHGRAFRIIIPRQLEEQKILHRYFGHSLFSTFLSQLRSSGFKPLVNTRNKGCYYHELMLRGLPHLCGYMHGNKDGSKLAPDPKSEPDFDAISAMLPLPLVSTSKTVTDPSSLPLHASASATPPLEFKVHGSSLDPATSLLPRMVSPTYSAASNENTTAAQPPSQLVSFLHEQMNLHQPPPQPIGIEYQLAHLLSNPNLLHLAQQQQMAIHSQSPSLNQPIDMTSLLPLILGLLSEQAHTKVPTGHHDPSLLLLETLLRHHTSNSSTHCLQQQTPVVQPNPQSVVNNLIAGLFTLPHTS